MSIINSIRTRIYNYLPRRKRALRVQKEGLDTVCCGNDYGGFNVVPSLLSETPVVFSFGIGEDLSFSQAVIDDFHAKVYAFDPTPRSVAYVKRNPLSQNPDFSFSPIGIASYDGTAEFHLPQNEAYVSGSMVPHEGVKTDSIQVPMQTLSTIMENQGCTHIDILKLDIEGSEFDILDDIVANSDRITELCLEVHDRYFEDGLSKLEEMRCKLNQAGFFLVCVKGHEELTFVKD